MIKSRRIPFTPKIIVNNGDTPPLKRIHVEDVTAEDIVDRLRTALRDRIEDLNDIAFAIDDGHLTDALEMCDVAAKRCQQMLKATGPRRVKPDGAA